MCVGVGEKGQVVKVDWEFCQLISNVAALRTLSLIIILAVIKENIGALLKFYYMLTTC